MQASTEKSPYTAVQFIAYNIVTDPPFFPFARPVSLEEDARLRAWNICNVIDLCQKFVEPDPQVLKVFLAPEFFFRPVVGVDLPGQPAAARLYSNDSFNEIVNIIRKHCRRRRYNDWFIVPGSILSMEFNIVNVPVLMPVTVPMTVPATVPPMVTPVPVPVPVPVYFNTVAYFYREGGEVNAGFVHKLRFSNIDRLNTAYQAPLNPLYNEYITDTNEPISLLGKMQIGIEICLDHALGTVKKQIQQQGLDWRWLNIQLLTACGMMARPEHIRVRNRGYFFRCDGHPNMMGSNLYQILWNGSTIDMSRQPAPQRRLDLPPELQIRRDNNQQPAYIHIYPKLDLPGGL
ncbi:MAG TPA: hypothetical protein VKY19_17355 [Ktedonosporobacter sp.]|jgi:hypothetical protein|nr:hypothetical protein [Ktedonosporobacter sp.]